MVNRIPQGWDNSNADDFKKWVEDNRGKTDEGCEVIEHVMRMGSDIASAAAVKWFRDSGKMKQEEVTELVDEISRRIIDLCKGEQNSVIKDCASIYAGTGNVGMVMMMAFVCYSVIGVRVAASIMADHS